MLVIREAQMQVLSGLRRDAFNVRCETHLKANFACCAAMSPRELRTMVEQGTARAMSYGIEAERDVCKFLNLIAVLGRDFDLRYQWARKTLASDAGPRLRLNRLYEQAIRAADSGAVR
jgi:hypothetical protein